MRKRSNDTIRARGFFRVQITDDKEGRTRIVGDSGWKENTVTNLGFQHYLVELLGAIAGSSQASYLALGTGGAPATGDTALTGELTHTADARKSASNSVVSSKTLQMTAAFNSADSFITAAANISN